MTSKADIKAIEQKAMFHLTQARLIYKKQLLANLTSSNVYKWCQRRIERIEALIDAAPLSELDGRGGVYPDARTIKTPPGMRKNGVTGSAPRLVQMIDSVCEDCSYEFPRNGQAKKVQCPRCLEICDFDDEKN